MPREKNRTFSFRLDDGDFEIMKAACEDLGLSKSDYIRYLMRIPLAADGVEPPCRCIVLDRKTFNSLSKELVRWGYHYNQAVRALNAITLHIRNGSLDDEWFAEMLGKIERELEDVNFGRDELAKKIEALKEETTMRSV